MIKLLSLLMVVAECYASYQNYGGGGGYGQSGGVIPAAVQSVWRLDVKPVNLPQQPIQPQVIEVPPLELPVKIIYHSKSSGVFVQQVHQPGEPGQAEATKSEEEPHKLSHEVIRPVIQELREVIIPYRRVVQEIAPVVEEVQTIVARGEGRQNAAQGQGGGVLPSITSGTASGGPGVGSGGGGNAGGTRLRQSNIAAIFGGDGGVVSGLGGYGSYTHGSDSLDAGADTSSKLGKARA